MRERLHKLGRAQFPNWGWDPNSHPSNNPLLSTLVLWENELRWLLFIFIPNKSWLWALVWPLLTPCEEWTWFLCAHVMGLYVAMEKLVKLSLCWLPGSHSPRTVLRWAGCSAFLSLRQSRGHGLLWWLVCLSVSGLGGRRVKLDSLCLSVYSFVGPLSSCQPSQWDNCPLYNHLPTFRVVAFTVPILLWNSITTGLWMQSFMISGYKQCAEQQRHLLYFLIFL